MKLRDLQDPAWNIFCNYDQDSDDMETFKKDLGLETDVTGMVGLMEDGGIEELWVTFSYRPWDLQTEYTQIMKEGRRRT